DYRPPGDYGDYGDYGDPEVPRVAAPLIPPEPLTQIAPGAAVPNQMVPNQMAPNQMVPNTPVPPGVPMVPAHEREQSPAEFGTEEPESGHTTPVGEETTGSIRAKEIRSHRTGNKPAKREDDRTNPQELDRLLGFFDEIRRAKAWDEQPQPEEVPQKRAGGTRTATRRRR